MKRNFFNYIILGLSLGGILYLGVNLESHQQWGLPIISFVQTFRNPFVDIIMRIGSLLGFELLVLLIPILSWTKRKNLILLGLQVTHVSVFGLYIVSLLKNYFQELRPYQSHDFIQGDYSGSIEYSFPSGHTWCSTIVWIVICEFLMEITKKKFLPILFVTFNSLIVGFSRVYFGVHYPHDVLAGYLGAVFTVVLHSQVFDINLTRSQKKGVQKLFNATFLMTFIGYAFNFVIFGVDKVKSHLGLFGVPGIMFGLWIIEEFFEKETHHEHEVVLWKRMVIGSLIVGIIFASVMVIQQFIIRTLLSSLGVIWIHFFAPKIFAHLHI